MLLLLLLFWGGGGGGGGVVAENRSSNLGISFLLLHDIGELRSVHMILL